MLGCVIFFREHLEKDWMGLDGMGRDRADRAPLWRCFVLELPELPMQLRSGSPKAKKQGGVCKWRSANPAFRPVFASQGGGNAMIFRFT